MSHVSVGAENARLIHLYYADEGSGPPMVIIHGYPLGGRGRGDIPSQSRHMLEHIASATGSHAKDRRRAAASAYMQVDSRTGIAAVETLLSSSLVQVAWQGQEAPALELIEEHLSAATTAGDRGTIALAEYARAILYNGLARYETALAAAERTCGHEHSGLFPWALAELVEAGVRTGNLDVAWAALRRMEGWTPTGDRESALALRARSRALLSGRADADVLYREALARLTSGRVALHLARTHLLYGEWLRRQRRRVDARTQLRTAHGMFSRNGADGFARRARRELLATGETARKRSVEAREPLTAQEAEIARLASAGHTNPEIGVALFISPRTVEWHLRKVFTKLNVSSRRQLREALPAGAARGVVPAS